MEVMSGPVAIISTVALFGVLGLVKYFLLKKRIIPKDFEHSDHDYIKDPNNPASPIYTDKRPG